MTAIVLITGRLLGEPVTRQTKTGGAVTFFKLKVAHGSAVRFWSVATFNDAVREELARLPEGAAISCSGQFDVENYEWRGETRLNFKLTTDAILALKPARLKATEKRAIPRQNESVTREANVAPGLWSP